MDLYAEQQPCRGTGSECRQHSADRHVHGHDRGWDAQVVTITINGANDSPTATANTFSVTEAQVEVATLATPEVLGNLITSGTADSDLDGGTLSVTGLTAAPVFAEVGAIANMALEAVASQTLGSGEVARYRFRVDNSSPTLVDQDAYLSVMGNGEVRIWSDSGEDPFRGMAAGQTATITFTYTLSDGQGGTNTASATITINGSNDLSVISGPATGSVTEAGGVNNGTLNTPTATGNLAAEDSDGTDDAGCRPGRNGKCQRLRYFPGDGGWASGPTR